MYRIFSYLECDCREGQFNDPSDKSLPLFMSENRPGYEDIMGVCKETTGVFNEVALGGGWFCEQQ